MNEITAVFQAYEKQVRDIREGSSRETSLSFDQTRKKILSQLFQDLSIADQKRLMEEVEGWGPLEGLLEDPEITEIIINSRNNLWIEKAGRLQKWPQEFLSDSSLTRILERLCLEANCLPSLESPSGNGHWRQFRVHVIRAPLVGSPFSLTLRRHPENPWSLPALIESGWCSREEADLLQQLLIQRKNFLIIGSTGSGKTSVINALLRTLPTNQRCGVIEDTDEIKLPEGASYKLLTREQTPEGLPAIDQGELVRQSLRMRPDRLVLGEIRGGEAKDFLMALSTGHRGSFGTLHADDAAQALIRLEMLIQMGAPQWSLEAIRKLIRFGLDAVIVTRKNENGERRFGGLHHLLSLEESGFLLEEIKPPSSQGAFLGGPERSLRSGSDPSPEPNLWGWSQRTS